MPHFDTGFIGTDVLLEVLFNYGYEDIAFHLLNNTDVGSFLYMKNQGATTLWESFMGGTASHFHPMFGGCTRQLFSSILGIKQCKGSAGYRRIKIEPKIPKALSFAKGSIETPYGEISVEWCKKSGETTLRYQVPEGVIVEK